MGGRCAADDDGRSEEMSLCDHGVLGKVRQRASYGHLSLEVTVVVLCGCLTFQDVVVLVDVCTLEEPGYRQILRNQSHRNQLSRQTLAGSVC